MVGTAGTFYAGTTTAAVRVTVTSTVTASVCPSVVEQRGSGYAPMRTALAPRAVCVDVARPQACLIRSRDHRSPPANCRRTTAAMMCPTESMGKAR